MKQFFIISTLVMMACEAMACAWGGNHNYYLFSVYQRETFSTHAYRGMLGNWEAYTDGAVKEWFDADEVMKAARKKNDALMVSYLENLEKYLAYTELLRNTWNYPTKQELTRGLLTVGGVRTYALSKLNTRLRSQHALLLMRCNMVLGRHQENVTFWEQKGMQYIESVYKDMMRNIYAGALLKTGKTEQASEIFAEQGDTESLYTYYYKKRSCAEIMGEYQKNPNSPVLPFLVQDFANNTQEAIDLEKGELSYWPGKLFIRDIKRSEARQMCDFARQVAKEGKTRTPALWKSLEGWLCYLLGQPQQALTAITEATKLDGTPRMKDNARALRLFIKAGTADVDASFNDFIATELAWLEEKASEERQFEPGYDNHYTEVFERLVHQVLVGKYEHAGQYEKSAALLAVHDQQPKTFYQRNRQAEATADDDEYQWNDNYDSNYFYYIDTMKVERLEHFVAYMAQKPKTSLDRFLLSRLSFDREFAHELIGTKYLRRGLWRKAIPHLEKVSIDFVNQMNIAFYMARRRYDIEPWMERQWIKGGQPAERQPTIKENQKLAFAREMRNLEMRFYTSKGTEHWRSAYQLAVRYYQASYAGDCWYLTRYGQSVADTLRTGEHDFIDKACRLLRIAQKSDDFYAKEKALFALTFTQPDCWYDLVWDNKELDFAKKAKPATQQYRALATFVDFEKNNASRTSDYVSRCDVIRQFRKQY